MCVDAAASYSRFTAPTAATVTNKPGMYMKNKEVKALGDGREVWRTDFATIFAMVPEGPNQNNTLTLPVRLKCARRAGGVVVSHVDDVPLAGCSREQRPIANGSGIQPSGGSRGNPGFRRKQPP